MVKVSVCIPTYNRADYLQYAVNSVLQQTYEDWELIVCDDGSTDNTAEIIGNYDESRLHYVRHPENIGRSRNMRSGFEAAKGEYFIKFDDDDAIASDFLAKEGVKGTLGALGVGAIFGGAFAGKSEEEVESILSQHLGSPVTNTARRINPLACRSEAE